MSVTEWVAVIGTITAAVVSLIKVWYEADKGRAEAARVRAEVAGMREDLTRDREGAKRTAALVAETHHQVTPNGGGSLMDASTRTELVLTDVLDGLATLLARVDRLDEATRGQSADVRGMRRDIGRLADSDQHILARKERDHDHINARIDELAERLGRPYPDSSD